MQLKNGSLVFKDKIEDREIILEVEFVVRGDEVVIVNYEFSDLTTNVWSFCDYDDYAEEEGLPVEKFENMLRAAEELIKRKYSSHA